MTTPAVGAAVAQPGSGRAGEGSAGEGSAGKGNAGRGNAGLVDAALLALLGAGVLVDAQGYPPALADGAPGPAFFPRLVAALLVLGAGALAARTLRQRRKAPPAVGGVLRLLAAAGWIGVFLLLLPVLGSLVTLPFLVSGLAWLAGERSLRILIVLPLAFAGFVRLLFGVVLGVPIP